ncbi:MAG: hypothetical protein EZS28_006487 [Streblomastix strix]|uniref:Uncharacterized protein n=1 Tax=Streblomastix strix TaxID=222440 RepID=A0A5J4WS77_9EUKA|nr:MAG: hypothetical protein EZS28_006487 [Streblomastix strix]
MTQINFNPLVDPDEACSFDEILDKASSKREFPQHNPTEKKIISEKINVLSPDFNSITFLKFVHFDTSFQESLDWEKLVRDQITADLSDQSRTIFDHIGDFYNVQQDIGSIKSDLAELKNMRYSFNLNQNIVGAENRAGSLVTPQIQLQKENNKNQMQLERLRRFAFIFRMPQIVDDYIKSGEYQKLGWALKTNKQLLQQFSSSRIMPILDHIEKSVRVVRLRLATQLLTDSFDSFEQISVLIESLKALQARDDIKPIQINQSSQKSLTPLNEWENPINLFINGRLTITFEQLKREAENFLHLLSRDETVILRTLPPGSRSLDYGLGRCVYQHLYSIGMISAQSLKASFPQIPLNSNTNTNQQHPVPPPPLIASQLDRDTQHLQPPNPPPSQPLQGMKYEDKKQNEIIDYNQLGLIIQRSELLDMVGDPVSKIPEEVEGLSMCLRRMTAIVIGFLRSMLMNPDEIIKALNELDDEMTEKRANAEQYEDDIDKGQQKFESFLLKVLRYYVETICELFGYDIDDEGDDTEDEKNKEEDQEEEEEEDYWKQMEDEQEEEEEDEEEGLWFGDDCNEQREEERRQRRQRRMKKDNHKLRNKNYQGDEYSIMDGIHSKYESESTLLAQLSTRVDRRLVLLVPEALRQLDVVSSTQLDAYFLISIKQRLALLLLRETGEAIVEAATAAPPLHLLAQSVDLSSLLPHNATPADRFLESGGCTPLLLISNIPQLLHAQSREEMLIGSLGRVERVVNHILEEDEKLRVNPQDVVNAINMQPLFYNQSDSQTLKKGNINLSSINNLHKPSSPTTILSNLKAPQAPPPSPRSVEMNNQNKQIQPKQQSNQPQPPAIRNNKNEGIQKVPQAPLPQSANVNVASSSLNQSIQKLERNVLYPKSHFEKLQKLIRLNKKFQLVKDRQKEQKKLIQQHITSPFSATGLNQQNEQKEEDLIDNDNEDTKKQLLDTWTTPEIAELLEMFEVEESEIEGYGLAGSDEQNKGNEKGQLIKEKKQIKKKIELKSSKKYALKQKTLSHIGGWNGDDDILQEEDVIEDNDDEMMQFGVSSNSEELVNDETENNEDQVPQSLDEGEEQSGFQMQLKKRNKRTSPILNVLWFQRPTSLKLHKGLSLVTMRLLSLQPPGSQPVIVQSIRRGNQDRKQQFGIDEGQNKGLIQLNGNSSQGLKKFDEIERRIKRRINIPFSYSVLVHGQGMNKTDRFIINALGSNAIDIYPGSCYGNRGQLLAGSNINRINSRIKGSENRQIKLELREISSAYIITIQILEAKQIIPSMGTYQINLSIQDVGVQHELDSQDNNQQLSIKSDNSQQNLKSLQTQSKIAVQQSNHKRFFLAALTRGGIRGRERAREKQQMKMMKRKNKKEKKKVRRNNYMKNQGDSFVEFVEGGSSSFKQNTEEQNRFGQSGIAGHIANLSMISNSSSFYSDEYAPTDQQQTPQSSFIKPSFLFSTTFPSPQLQISLSNSQPNVSTSSKYIQSDSFISQDSQVSISEIRRVVEALHPLWIHSVRNVGFISYFCFSPALPTILSSDNNKNQQSMQLYEIENKYLFNDSKEGKLENYLEQKPSNDNQIVESQEDGNILNINSSNKNITTANEWFKELVRLRSLMAAPTPDVISFLGEDAKRLSSYSTQLCFGIMEMLEDVYSLLGPSYITQDQDDSQDYDSRRAWFVPLIAAYVGEALLLFADTLHSAFYTIVEYLSRHLSTFPQFDPSLRLRQLWDKERQQMHRRQQRQKMRDIYEDRIQRKIERRKSKQGEQNLDLNTDSDPNNYDLIISSSSSSESASQITKYLSSKVHKNKKKGNNPQFDIQLKEVENIAENQKPVTSADFELEADQHTTNTNNFLQNNESIQDGLSLLNQGYNTQQFIQNMNQSPTLFGGENKLGIGQKIQIQQAGPQMKKIKYLRMSTMMTLRQQNIQQTQIYPSGNQQPIENQSQRPQTIQFQQSPQQMDNIQQPLSAQQVKINSFRSPKGGRDDDEDESESEDNERNKRRTPTSRVNEQNDLDGGLDDQLDSQNNYNGKRKRIKDMELMDSDTDDDAGIMQTVMCVPFPVLLDEKEREYLLSSFLILLYSIVVDILSNRLEQMKGALLPNGGQDSDLDHYIELPPLYHTRTSTYSLVFNEGRNGAVAVPIFRSTSSQTNIRRNNGASVQPFVKSFGNKRMNDLDLQKPLSRWMQVRPAFERLKQLIFEHLIRIRGAALRRIILSGINDGLYGEQSSSQDSNVTSGQSAVLQKKVNTKAKMAASQASSIQSQKLAGEKGVEFLKGGGDMPYARPYISELLVELNLFVRELMFYASIILEQGRQGLNSKKEHHATLNYNNHTNYESTTETTSRHTTFLFALDEMLFVLVPVIFETMAHSIRFMPMFGLRWTIQLVGEGLYLKNALSRYSSVQSKEACKRYISAVLMHTTEYTNFSAVQNKDPISVFKMRHEPLLKYMSRSQGQSKLQASNVLMKEKDKKLKK